MAKKINVTDYAKDILKALPAGILLNTEADGKQNTMTIGWGSLGTNFGKNVFTVYVRKSRYSHVLLDKNPVFTISVPLGEADEKIKKALAVCGSETGAKTDKFKKAGLTAVKGKKISAPAIAEFPLTLECKVIYRAEEKIPLISEAYQNFYPMNNTKYNITKEQDPHFIYQGEIVAAYILEPED